MTKFACALVLLFATALPSFGNEPCNDSGLIYKICSDQQEIFTGALERANASDKILLVKFGADWCPWCRSLHKIFTDPEFIAPLSSQLEVVEIGVYHPKSADKIPSGIKVLEDIIALSGQQVQVNGVPFLALYNPKNQKVFFQNTGELELNTATSKGHDRNKVSRALLNGIESIR
ncbi:MAG: thioredoxin family protein [Bdellovibrionaceae bacterium]|nr:thioredoxin family protein [Bdellovibrionales bacterium]MCB9085875.1 thioredoxin family protein [Pseudobdellovibrionaceae bacterium]